MAPSTHPRMLQIISGVERLMRAFRMLRMSRTSPSIVKLIQGLMRQTFLVLAPWTRQAQITMEKIAAMRKATPKMKIPDEMVWWSKSCLHPGELWSISCTTRSMNAWQYIFIYYIILHHIFYIFQQANQRLATATIITIVRFSWPLSALSPTQDCYVTVYHNSSSSTRLLVHGCISISKGSTNL